MRDDIMISVLEEFSRTPGGRSTDEGDFSGELFLSDVLKPKFERALGCGTKLVVNLDGTAGYATSFLEASFGGLSREYGSEKVLSSIILISEEEPYLIEEIQEYIRDAKA